MNTLRAVAISKSFANRVVLRKVACELSSGNTTAIIGANGSGKSTLAKILSGMLRPDQGTIELIVHGKLIERTEIPSHCGYVAPYLTLYEEFTPIELLQMHAALHGMHIVREEIFDLLHRVGLSTREDSRVRTFSSGMKQRLALALAVSTKPALLVLDEPSSTLDEDGRMMLASEMRRAELHGAIIVLATNDPREIELCQSVISVE